MAQQEQIKKQKRTSPAEAEQLAEQDAEVQAAQDKEAVDLAESDALLDEIDALLEEQDVLVNYRQRGGQ